MMALAFSAFAQGGQADGVGLLRALLGQGAFSGPDFLDLVALAVLGVVVFQLVRRRRQGGGASVSRPEAGAGDVNQGGEPENLEERHARARAEWDRLMGGGAPGSVASGPAASPAAAREGGEPGRDFLSGAKAAFARIHELAGRRDFESMSLLVLPKALEHFKAAAEKEPEARSVEIMLVDASQEDAGSDGTRQWVLVRYDALLREGLSGQAPVQRRALWKFSKSGVDAADTWKLDEILE